jgi:uncharacterized Zn-binding protein involved in type VI secretion
MPGATRKTVDMAGGKLIGASGNVFTNNQGQVRVGDKVEGHGKSPHSSPVMAKGSSTVFVNGIAACRAGDKASCDHPASGSSNVFIG